MDERVNRYINEGGWATLVGACDSNIYAVLSQIDAIQRENEILGDMAEIGVAGGRLLIMLGLLARPQEHVLAIDVFDVQDNYDPTGGTTTVEGVRSAYRNYVGSTDQLRLVVGDSMQLTAPTIRESMASKQMRVFSVDGAHSHFHTSNDMRLAEEVLAPGGVVMVDDITNAGWPGVIEGVARYFLNQSCCKLFPFMMAYNKLWLTTHDYHERYLRYALDEVPLFSPGLHKRVTRFFGVDIVGF